MKRRKKKRRPSSLYGKTSKQAARLVDMLTPDGDGPNSWRSFRLTWRASQWAAFDRPLLRHDAHRGGDAVARAVAMLRERRSP